MSEDVTTFWLDYVLLGPASPSASRQRLHCLEVADSAGWIGRAPPMAVSPEF